MESLTASINMSTGGWCGPIGASPTVVRLRHLATVLELMSYRAARRAMLS
ncbi:MAG: hypothetical protein H0W77_00955 [Acidobacteria bacterium]|nr:hypothetical protein [Acidobacteriota bacterium]